MIKKPDLLYIFLFFAIFLFAFRNPDKTSDKQSISNQFSGVVAVMKSDTGGRTVSLDSAQACINRFAAVMKAHGFSDPGGQSVDIRIKKTSMITTGESFDGKGLLDWLNATAAQYSAAGKTLMIKIEMGIYDMNYLNTYQPNAALKSANNNRIAIFLIPYDASTGPGIHPLVAPVPPPPGGTGTGGGTGYDLGGLQP
jgi:hypothetical protein